MKTVANGVRIAAKPASNSAPTPAGSRPSAATTRPATSRRDEYRSWSYGQSMPYAYRTQRYVINDYHRYGLARPPHGYEYVRSGNDVVLAAVAGGLISAVIAGLFN